MQTEDHARAIMSTAPNNDDDAIENKIEVREKRRARLTGDDPLSVWLVLDEAVIRRVVGGPKVMGEQLGHLVALSELRNVTLQVLPLAAGEHAATHGAFKLLSSRRRATPTRSTRRSGSAASTPRSRRTWTGDGATLHDQHPESVHMEPTNATWRKSARSGDNGGDCVEVAAVERDPA